MDKTNELHEVPEGERGAQALTDSSTAFEEILERIEAGLSEDQTKPTISDLIRLLELRLEFRQMQPQQPMTVRWIDEWPSTQTSEE